MTDEEKKESKKASAKKYRENNKAKTKARDKKYKEENKEKIKAYREKNEEKIIEYIKEYKQTPEGIKSYKISSWKRTVKIISDDWDATYEWFMNTKNCEKCDVVLESGRGKNGKCLDHDHSITDRPNARAVLCMDCNRHEGHKRHASKEECDKHYKEKIKCVCGSNVSRKYMKEHEKTSKHINFHINLNA
tara:strand:+ start:173 stop:742 length:570 start_codon:yes stop_codon:yes gene_type:complete